MELLTSSNGHIKSPIDFQSITNSQQDTTVTTPSNPKAAKTAKAFESLLTQMMVKQMMASTGGVFGDNKQNFGGDFFEGMFEEQIANKISGSSNLGLANKIYKQITGEELPTNGRISEIPSFSPEEDDTFDEPIEVAAKPAEKVQKQPAKIEISGSAQQRLQKLEPYINEASKKYGVDKSLIKSVIMAESAARPDAKSKTNAKGLMQLMDGTAKMLGVNNVWDPKQNIMGGTKYLSQLMDKFNGNEKLAIAAYNAGPGNVTKYNGIPPFKETKNYVARVVNYKQQYFDV